MGAMSEGATAEPTVVHTSHRYRLTAIHLSPYPFDHGRYIGSPHQPIQLLVVQRGPSESPALQRGLNGAVIVVFLVVMEILL